MERKTLPRQSYRNICTSGDNIVLTVPTNMIGHVTNLEIDSHNQSGLTASITLQLVDSYTPTGGSATRAILKELTIVPGSYINIDTKDVPEVMGALLVNTNYTNSGPVTTVGMTFE